MPEAEQEVVDVFEFEGDEVNDFMATIPSTRIEVPGAWARGTMLNMNVNLRVRSVRLEEDRKGKLTRLHMLVVEDVTVMGILTPQQRRAAMAQQEAEDLANQPKVIEEEPGQEDALAIEGAAGEEPDFSDVEAADAAKAAAALSEAEAEEVAEEFAEEVAEAEETGIVVTDVEQTETADPDQLVDADTF